MKARELKPVFKSLLPSIPGFTFHKSFPLITPMRGMLRAINFDSSAYDKESFYPVAFVMPLFDPNDADRDRILALLSVARGGPMHPM